MSILSDSLAQRISTRIREQRHLPESTYRVQLHCGFTFKDAIKILPYLRDLGITHFYASPYLKARAGSTHGYDVVDPGSLNPEIGTAGDHEAFLSALRDNGLFHILDIVPNHMGVGTNENPWWNDVLWQGMTSRYAEYFDIAWNDPPRPQLLHRVLLPVLGSPLGEIIDKGELKLRRVGRRWFVFYFDRRFPVTNGSSDRLESRAAGSAEITLPAEEMEGLLSEQPYRLSYWRTGPDEINYRRFFEINDLAALRMERPEVFEDVHRLVMSWLGTGKLAGVRIDHPDGLLDPQGYLCRLQERYVEACAAAEKAADSAFAGVSETEVDDACRLASARARETPNASAQHPLYVVVEKILAADESLRSDWPVDGTSGYDFLTATNGLFVDHRSERSFTEFYRDFTADARDFADLVHQTKLQILDTSLGSDLEGLTRRLDKLAQQNPHTRDFTFRQLRDALRQLIASFPVYRSFVTAGHVSKDDSEVIDTAISTAKKRAPTIDEKLISFIRAQLLLESGAAESTEYREDQFRFTGRFQQLTAPVTAKGVEDTAFYIHARLISLNEVGGDPGCFGTSPATVHEYFRQRQVHFPYALSALSTHDTKRSEDVRARINVLSEIPDEWCQNVNRWSELNAGRRKAVDGKVVPSPSEELFFYQSLLGAWPLEWEAGLEESFADRILEYLQKWLREAKVNTSWSHPHTEYEEAFAAFARELLDPGVSNCFLEDFRPFLQRIIHHGRLNSLSQTLIRLTAPGVPDTYQGTETWDFSLVDPDNRRPVDYQHRRELLKQVKDEREPVRIEKLSALDPKILITHVVLNLRRENPGLFSVGQYVPLRITGEDADCFFAFARNYGTQTAIVLAPRLTTRLNFESLDESLSVELPAASKASTYRNAFTGAQLKPTSIGRQSALSIRDLFGPFSVALLIGSDGG